MTPDGTVTLLLAGDVMTGRGVDQALRHHAPPQLYEPVVDDAREYLRLAEAANGPVGAPLAPHEPWGAARAQFLAPDVDARVVNLETAVTAGGAPWPRKGIHYRMHPANVDVLTAAHVDVCTVANNHVLDWGRDALRETLAALHAAGIATVGAGADADAAWRPAAIDLGSGRRLLVFGLATDDSGVPADWAAAGHRAGVARLPDLSPSSAQRVAECVQRHRRAGDLVVVSIHWGGNWVPAVPQAQRDFARRLVDIGVADVVHGHSAHHPLPVELYAGHAILHGCGDLINDYEGIGDRGPWRHDVALLWRLRLDTASGRLRRLDAWPLQRRRLRLQPADADAVDALRRLLQPDAAAGWRHGADGGWTLAPA
ncbi:CapA family protein [Calidifontimicrobium sp. SYSU G02091]|uniref:CapA family protein n=1 Tax=Calidifontimicrobium sp. SYSU G02091 TaxID=2926421 RepID=UPI001F53CAC0|nr:CapA family protein [Calidifontimicrobium sp. SYSU G02091]MCI1191927.1 CapA family protein [Calidifontimicrobium sp. SYSU G02091]